MINNRQNGRRRGRGGQQRPQGGSSPGSRDSGNRIDSRARGNASQLYEKYKNMASDAQRQGDRVNTEYYLQFADHYFRVMADQRGRYEDQQPRRQQNDFDSDDDFGDEGEPIRADEQGRSGEDRGDRDGNRQNENGRTHDGNRQYDGNRQRADRDDGRQRSDRDDNRQRAEGDEGRSRDDHRQRDGQSPRQRQNAPRASEPRTHEPRREERPNGGYMSGEFAPSGAEPSQPAMPEAEMLRAETGDVAAAPKRRGRPRKTPVEAGEQLGLDSSVLPPSIGVPEASEESAAPKPRRRRVAPAPAEATSS